MSITGDAETREGTEALAALLLRYAVEFQENETDDMWEMAESIHALLETLRESARESAAMSITGDTSNEREGISHNLPLRLPSGTAAYRVGSGFTVYEYPNGDVVTLSLADLPELFRFVEREMPDILRR